MSSTPPQPGQSTFHDNSNSPSRAACRNAAITRSSSSPFFFAKSSALMRTRCRSGASRTSRSIAAAASGLADCRSAAKRACVSIMEKAYAILRDRAIPRRHVAARRERRIDGVELDEHRSQRFSDRNRAADIPFAPAPVKAGKLPSPAVAGIVRSLHFRSRGDVRRPTQAPSANARRPGLGTRRRALSRHRSADLRLDDL